MSGLYLACLSLAKRDVLVAGGGSVALRKVTGLLRAGAQVTVVAPQVCRGLARLRTRLKIRRRAYRTSDLRNRWLVVAATGDPEVNRKIFEDASRARVFCNVVDQPALCTFQVPAVVRRGRLQIGISTDGASPALARNIRRQTRKGIRPRVRSTSRCVARTPETLQAEISGRPRAPPETARIVPRILRAGAAAEACRAGRISPRGRTMEILCVTRCHEVRDACERKGEA